MAVAVYLAGMHSLRADVCCGVCSRLDVVAVSSIDFAQWTAGGIWVLEDQQRSHLLGGGDYMINIILPWPPSVNRIWRSVGGRVLLSAEGRTYRQAVEVAVLEQHGAGDPLTGRLSMTIRAYPPDRRRRDVDNMAKAILDAIEHAGSVYVNDSQIDHLSIRRMSVEKPGRVEVSIRQIDLHISDQTCDD